MSDLITNTRERGLNPTMMYLFLSPVDHTEIEEILGAVLELRRFRRYVHDDLLAQVGREIRAISWYWRH